MALIVPAIILNLQYNRRVTLIWFILGLGAGGLLNSLADNLPPDSLGGRYALRPPHCGYCGRSHRPRDWLALANRLTRRGRCEHCSAPRSPRHWIVEVVTGLSWAWAWQWAGGMVGRALPAMLILSVFILIIVIDVEHRLILWNVIWPSALLILVLNGLSPERGWEKTLQGGLAGYGIVWGVYKLAEGYAWLVGRLRGEPLTEVAFGGGDVNLAGVLGLTVGWTGIVLSLIITVFAGGLFSAIFMIVQTLRRKYNPHTPLPYAPFLIFGAIIIYFFGAHIKTWAAGR